MSTNRRCVVIGSGIGGLATAALLARAGYNVTVLEAHPNLIGGHAQTIEASAFRFSAGPRYLWNFAVGEPGYRFLEKCGLLDKVPLVELDRSGFDHIYVNDNEPIQVPNGWDEYETILSKRFPTDVRSIARFFELCRSAFCLFDFANKHSLTLQPWPTIVSKYIRSLPARVLGLPSLLSRSSWTLQRAFDHCGLPRHLQSILYAHGMIFALPQSEVSFYAYAAATLFYHNGSYYPKYDMAGFVGALIDTIESNGGVVQTSSRVVSVETRGQRIVSVSLETGDQCAAEVFVANTDPVLFMTMLNKALPNRIEYPKYDYSNSLVAIYLGLRDVAVLRKHFGPWNIWYTTGSQENEYDNDASDTIQSLYLNSPTLVTRQADATSENAATVTGFVPSSYKRLSAIRDGSCYNEAVDYQRGKILEFIERRFIPNLRDVLECCVIRTPCDHAQDILAPRGNVYGRRLTPRGALQHLPWKGLLPNLYFVGAVVGFPGVSSVINNAIVIYEEITGDRVR